MNYTALSYIAESIGLEFYLKQIPYNVNYKPTQLTRMTTNYANLARGELRQSNIKSVLKIINTKLNKILRQNSSTQERYEIDLFINQIAVRLNSNDEWFPLIEMLGANIIDKNSLINYPCSCGFNLSSYIRDFDFNVILPKIKLSSASKEEIVNFGVLHGKLFQLQFKEFYSNGVLNKPVFIALSVANGKVYHRTDNFHTILGFEYLEQGEASITSEYFAKMGMQVKYFMPEQCQAPLAIYHYPGTIESADKYSLAGLIATMDTFQRIYRPEIYNPIAPASEVFNPSLANQSYHKPLISYDRNERKILGVHQALLVDEFIHKHFNLLGKLVL